MDIAQLVVEPGGEGKKSNISRLMSSISSLYLDVSSSSDDHQFCLVSLLGTLSL